MLKFILKMASKIVSACTCFTTLCLLMILIVQEIQGKSFQPWQQINPSSNKRFEVQYNFSQSANNPLSIFLSNKPVPLPNWSNMIWDPKQVSDFFHQKLYESGQYGFQPTGINSGLISRPEKKIDHAEKKYEYSDRIIFPDEIAQLKKLKHNMSSVPICNQNGSTFCLNANDYPEKLVNLTIQQNNSLTLMETLDELSDISNKIDESIEAPLCRSYIQVVYPKSAKSLKRDWLYVVNQPNFKQGIRIEVCVREGNPCSDLEDVLPEGYKVFCKQKYFYRELMAVMADGSIRKEVFKFPSSCCCHKVPTEMFINFRK